MPIRALAALAALLVLAIPGHGAETGLVVDRAWARATPPGADTAAVYLRIANPAGAAADTLVGASTEVAAQAQLHSQQEDHGVLRMRPVAALPIGPGQVVEARPGGMHVMLNGLGKPLAAGQAFTLKLRFERAGDIPVPVKVEGIDFLPEEEHHHHHH